MLYSSMAHKAQRKFTDREEPKKIFLEKLAKPQAKDEYRLLTCSVTYKLLSKLVELAIVVNQEEFPSNKA